MLLTAFQVKKLEQCAAESLCIRPLRVIWQNGHSKREMGVLCPGGGADNNYNDDDFVPEQPPSPCDEFPPPFPPSPMDDPTPSDAVALAPRPPHAEEADTPALPKSPAGQTQVPGADGNADDLIPPPPPPLPPSPPAESANLLPVESTQPEGNDARAQVEHLQPHPPQLAAMSVQDMEAGPVSSSWISRQDFHVAPPVDASEPGYQSAMSSNLPGSWSHSVTQHAFETQNGVLRPDPSIAASGNVVGQPGIGAPAQGPPGWASSSQPPHISGRSGESVAAGAREIEAGAAGTMSSGPMSQLEGVITFDSLQQILAAVQSKQGQPTALSAPAAEPSIVAGFGAGRPGWQQPGGIAPSGQLVQVKTERTSQQSRGSLNMPCEGINNQS